LEEQIFLKKKINKNIPIPLYYQLKELLLEFIENAGDNTVLPTETALCELYDISRSTVRQAMGELTSEGYITRKKGKGTTILPRKIKQDFLVILESFNNEMQQKGLKPKTEVISRIVTSPYSAVQKFLNLTQDAEVVQLVRLRSIDEKPLVLVTTYLPADYHNLRNIIDEDLEHKSMYKLMEQNYNTIIISCRRMLEIRLAGDFEAQHLKVEKGAPLQYIETLSTDADGQPIEFSKAFYRGDNNKFFIDTVRRSIK
jgi:GntR family transcriptional regulator